MEQPPVSELFSLTIDPAAKAHLSETARWAKFLAIAGFVFLALVLVYNIFFFIYISPGAGPAETNYGRSINIMENIGIGVLLLNLIAAGILFFPLLFLLRFANGFKDALAGNDQQALNLSFQNLKIFFRYWGIVMLIALGLFSVTFIVTIIGAVVL